MMFAEPSVVAVCRWSVNNMLWYHLTFSQDARKVTTSLPGLSSKSFHGKKNLKRFSHFLLGDKRIELTEPSV